MLRRGEVWSGHGAWLDRGKDGMSEFRKLAAILAADVVGYSRLAGADEERILARLRALRSDLIDPTIAVHHGRVVKRTGDGALVEFRSVVDAVRCAIEVQTAMLERNAGVPPERRIEFRIGIHIGDVVEESDGDLMGDGVNIASRLEGVAAPGAICLSEDAYRQVRSRLDLSVSDLGSTHLKNIAAPIRVFSLRVGTAELKPAASTESSTSRPSPLKLSIAVLPFANLSGDPEQEYFSDGITEDIITDLSKVSAISVTARNTTFAFKGKMVDVSRIADQLKASHVLEGSVRKSGGRVRISAQLIDGRVGDHIWAERYDRDLKDIFALQDEISHAIVAALKGKLLPEEKKAIETRSTHNAEAYQLYLLARYYQRMRSVRNLQIAIRFCQRALNIDPNYARAWALIALCQAILHTGGKSEQSGLTAAEKALTLDSGLAEAHAAKGRALAELGRLNEALAAHEESLRLEPDSNDVRHSFGRTCLWLGRSEDAVTHFERAALLLDSDYASPGFLSQSYRALGQHEEAKSSARWELERIEKEISLRPDNANAMMRGAVSLAYLGEKERAKEWAARALTIELDGDPIDQYNLACAFVHMNELDQAVDQLECCLSKTSSEFVLWVEQDGDLTPLHKHPRFQALIAGVKAKLAAAQADRTAESA
jgi:adenylate cyclase